MTVLGTASTQSWTALYVGKAVVHLTSRILCDKGIWCITFVQVCIKKYCAVHLHVELLFFCSQISSRKIFCIWNFSQVNKNQSHLRIYWIICPCQKPDQDTLRKIFKGLIKAHLLMLILTAMCHSFFAGHLRKKKKDQSACFF